LSAKYRAQIKNLTRLEIKERIRIDDVFSRFHQQLDEESLAKSGNLKFKI